ncbi:MAG: rhodanese-like domain-containing protein [Moraxella sp.]|nr:rhodanese-like domain-containing protein [Moraxella sp.]
MIKTLAISEFSPHERLTIWDVRDNHSFKNAHIPHAINVPIDHINADTLANTTGDIYVLCGGGTKAGRACELLDSLDPTRTYIHLTGGTRGAKALGWELVGEN